MIKNLLRLSLVVGLAAVTYAACYVSTSGSTCINWQVVCQQPPCAPPDAQIVSEISGTVWSTTNAAPGEPGASFLQEMRVCECTYIYLGGDGLYHDLQCEMSTSQVSYRAAQTHDCTGH